MSEILKVNFDNNTCIKYVDGLTQWDYGRVLEVAGLNLEESTVEVHFSLSEMAGEAKRSVATVINNVLTVPIPSIILESEQAFNYNAYAFIYISSASTGKTVKKIVFNVNARPKPADYVTPEEPDLLGQLIEKLDGKVDKVEGKGLSSNDFTNDDKDKLSDLPTAIELTALFAEQDEELEGVYEKLDSRITTNTSVLEDKITYLADDTDKEVADLKAKDTKIEQSVQELTGRVISDSYENKDIFANAVKATASGEVIRVDDVSPIEHTVNAKVSGKNLLNIDGMTNSNFVKNADGSFTFTKNGSARYTNFVDISIPANTIVTFSATKIEGTADGFAFQTQNTDGSYISIVSLSPTKTYATALVTKKPSSIRLYLGGTEKNGSYLKISGLQILLGDTVTEYEPYINPAAVTVTRCGKNEFDSERWYNELKENNGNIFKETINGVEYYKFRPGNASTYPFMEGEFEKNTSYTFSFLGIYDNATYPKATGFLLKYTDESSVFCIIDGATEKLYSVTTDSNKTLKCIRIYYAYNEYAYVRNLQLEKGDTATEFEAYKGETYTPDADGTVNITSVAPTMTLLTDTEGVNIKCEYNQDTNKALDNVNKDISELDKVTTELIEDMGEVETALDNIIAIQNTLIGGGS